MKAAGVRAAPESGGACRGQTGTLPDLYNLHQNTSARHFYSRENAEIAVNGRKKEKSP